MIRIFLACLFLSLPLCAEMTAESLREKMISAQGSPEVQASIKSIKSTASISMQAMAMQMEVVTISTSKAARSTSSMQGQVMADQGFDGQKAWSKDMMMGLRDLQDAEAFPLRMSTLEAIFDIGVVFDELVLKPDATFNGIQTHVLEGTRKGLPPVTLHVNPKSFLLEGMVMTQVTVQGTMKATSTCKSYATSKSGIRYCDALEVTAGPMAMEMKVTAFEENLPVDPKIFEKPAG